MYDTTLVEGLALLDPDYTTASSAGKDVVQYDISSRGFRRGDRGRSFVVPKHAATLGEPHV